MKLVLYADDSPLSFRARAFLKSQSLMFEEVDAKTPDGAARLLKRTRQSSVPALEIIRAHSLGVLAEFDEELWRVNLQAMIPRR